MTRTNLPLIGSRELVSFPELSIRDIPAKIDTGADFSSVWATDIVEADGVLSFRLFGRTSRYHSKQAVATKEYGVTKVKNSFGHAEIRYTVRLAVRLGGKRINAEFRLANRANNLYPVLIGKKTILGKYLVDVSVNSKFVAGKTRLLVLNSIQPKWVEGFTGRLKQTDDTITAQFRTYDEFIAVLSSKTGISLYDARTAKPLPKYDLIYFKTYAKRAEFAAVMAEYARTHHINFFDEEVASYQSLTKFSQYAKLAIAGLPIPKTVVMRSTQLAGNYDFIAAKLKVPFVLKDVASDKGESNFLVQSQSDYDALVGSGRLNNSYYAAQHFVPNDGDYRMIVLDKKLEVAIKRQRVDTSTHLNNTSAGGNATLVNTQDIPADVKAMAIKSALVLGRQVAGVDLMQSSKTGKWYILEVNNSPQLASGAFLDEKMVAFAKFIKRQARK